MNEKLIKKLNKEIIGDTPEQKAFWDGYESGINRCAREIRMLETIEVGCSDERCHSCYIKKDILSKIAHILEKEIETIGCDKK